MRAYTYPPKAGTVYRHGVGDTVYCGVGMPKASYMINQTSLHATFITTTNQP